MDRTEPRLAIRATAQTLSIATMILVGVGCTSPAAQVSQVPSATPEATQSLNASSPEPSTEPSTAALVLRLLGGGESGRVHLVTVLGDGRVITTSGYDQFEGPNPPVERLLTAAGVELLRDELAATGLTGTSADYSPIANPGVEAPGWGGAGPSLEVGLPGGSTAVISWVLFADGEQDYFQPQPEAEALEALAARLSTLEQWLPADAWVDASGLPYEPESYRVFIYSQQWGGSLDDLPVESATVSWPLVDGIDAIGDAVASVALDSGEGDTPPVCRPVDAEEAAPVVDALEAAGATPGRYSLIPGTAFELGHRATSRLVTITLQPILPLDEASC